MFGQHRPTGCPLRQGTNPLKIVIWTGPAWETWGPGSLHTGLGGSETAAIHMASELALWGHDVEIIGQVTPCEYNGVKFKNHLLCMNSPIECDVWISSRDPSVFRMLKPKAKLSVLWCHDIHMGDDYQGLVRQHDIVLCLSNWHRKILSTYYSDVPKEKFVVTRNGIDPKLFLREPKKNECKIIYSSSPDRGLDHLLCYWPKIREMRPDTELHVYYGFNTWQQMVDRSANKTAQLQINFFKERLAAMQDCGVFFHGRVGQVELAEAFLESSMWLYPTAFLETACISAMEAQAAGCLVITTRLAALAETVKYGFLVSPPNTETRYETEFLDHVKRFLKQPDDFSSHLHVAREWALRNLSWTQVAKQWEELFSEKLKA